MQARYYDPVIGRFLSNDPVGFSVEHPEMFNRYAYVGNDPLNKTDPTGEFAFLVSAVLSVGLEMAIQSAEIAVGARDGYDGRSIAVSAVAGAAGVGVISKAKRLGSVAQLGADVTGSVGASVAKGEEVSLVGVVADVVLGEGAGKVGGKIGKGVGDDIRQIAQPSSELRKRYPTRRQAARMKAGERQAVQAEADATAVASTLGANAGGDAIGIVECATQEGGC